MNLIINHIEDLKIVFNLKVEKVFKEIKYNFIISDLLCSTANVYEEELIVKLIEIDAIKIITFDKNAMVDIISLLKIFRESVSVCDASSLYMTDVFNGKMITNEEICVNQCETIGVQSTSIIELINYIKLNKTA